jgi:hypothetical protein
LTCAVDAVALPEIPTDALDPALPRPFGRRARDHPHRLRFRLRHRRRQVHGVRTGILRGRWWSALPSLSNWRYTRCSSAFRIVSACCIPEHPVRRQSISFPPWALPSCASPSLRRQRQLVDKRDATSTPNAFGSLPRTASTTGPLSVSSFMLSVHLQGVPRIIACEALAEAHRAGIVDLHRRPRRGGRSSTSRRRRCLRGRHRDPDR